MGSSAGLAAAEGIKLDENGVVVGGVNGWLGVGPEGVVKRPPKIAERAPFRRLGALEIARGDQAKGPPTPSSLGIGSSTKSRSKRTMGSACAGGRSDGERRSLVETGFELAASGRTTAERDSV